MANEQHLTVGVGVDLSDLHRGLSGIRTAVSGIGEQMRGVGASLTQSITIPLAALGAASYKTYGDIDALERSLAQYGTTLKEVKELAKLPGLGLEEAAGSLTSLLSVRYNADLARRAMVGFGNALTQTGKGKAELDGINTALAQMKGKGKVSAEEINQIAERLPMIRELMQKAFGTADTEALQKMGLTADQFLEKITVQLEKLPKATAGPKAIMENFFDSVKVGAYEVGKSFEQNFNISSKIQGLGDTIDKFSQSFADLSPKVQKSLLVLGGTVAVAGPATYAIGLLSSQIPTLVTGFDKIKVGAAALTSPLGLLAIAVTGVTIGAVSLYKTYNPTIVASKQLADVTEQVTLATEGEIGKLKDAVKAAANDKLSKEDRANALNYLKSQYPDYFSKLDMEKLKTSDLKKAYDALSTSILQAATARAQETNLQRLIGQQEEEKKIIIERRQELKDLIKDSQELSNTDIGMGNPAGTGTTVAIDVAARKLKNAKLQAAETKKAIDSSVQSISEYRINQGGKTIDQPIKDIDQGAKDASESVQNLIRDAEQLLEEVSKIRFTGGGPSSAFTSENWFTMAGDYQVEGLKSLKQLFEETFQTISAQAPQAQKALSELGESLVMDLGIAKEAVFGLGSVLSSSLGEALNQAFSTGKASLKGFVQSVLDGLRQMIVRLIAIVAVAELLNLALGGLGMLIPGIKGFGGKSGFNLLSKGMGLNFAAAKGGIVNGPKVGLVGEAGPEAIIPLNRLHEFINPKQGYAPQGGIDSRPVLIDLTTITKLDGERIAVNTQRHLANRQRFK